MPMVDPTTGSNLVTVTKPDGTQRHLKKCGPSDWMRLANTFRHTRKVWKMVSMTGQSPAAIQAVMDGLDKQRIFYDDICTFLVETWEGQFEAILLSLAKDHPFGTQRAVLEADFDSLELEPGTWLRPAAALFNVKLIPFEAAKKNDEGKNASTSGETTSPTTSEPPISSGTSSTLGTPTP